MWVKVVDDRVRYDAGCDAMNTSETATYSFRQHLSVISRANRQWWPQGVVFAGATGILATRLLTWPTSFAEDIWVYMLSGQALASGRRPPVDLTNTTPKPFATILAFVVSPFPPVRAMDAVVVLFTALLVASTYIYGYRLGGMPAACAAVAALVFLPALPIAFHGGQTDVISAALLVTAIVSPPRPRIVWLVLLGLLRPQAWLLAGIAGYLASTGRLPKRALAGVCWTVVPAVLWLLADEIINGSPLASYRANQRINHDVPWHTVVTSLRFFEGALRVDTGPWILVCGLAGFGVAAYRRRWRQDPFLACVLVILPVTLTATWLHMPYNSRYTFPVAILVPLGCAHLASLVRVPEKAQWVNRLAVPATLAIVGVAVLTMPQVLGLVNGATDSALDAPALVDRALPCGPVRVLGRPSPWFITLRLAVASRHPLSDFRYDTDRARIRDIENTAGVLLGPKPAPFVVTWLTRHDWQPTQLGRRSFWLSPACRT
jgi:hypothetical protein